MLDAAMMTETAGVSYIRMESPIGPLMLVADNTGLRRIGFVNERNPVRSDPQWRESVERLGEAVRQLRAYFAGELQAFDLPLAPQGTPFQLAVWKRLCEIPYGETTSYGELARRIGNPNASRAVGLANGSNPIPIVIPCHRVIGSNGKLTGYGGGLPIKEKLLGLERRQLRLL
jgi:methylated-DNA-[protein]-cysteine S-methyltransferase